MGFFVFVFFFSLVRPFLETVLTFSAFEIITEKSLQRSVESSEISRGFPIILFAKTPGLHISTFSILKCTNGLNNQLFHLNLLFAGRGYSLLKEVTWNIIWAKLLSCNNFKSPDILSEAPLPPTSELQGVIEPSSFLIQHPLTHSPLTLSPHKCIISSTTFLLKKMFCPPRRCDCIWETLSPSQDYGVNLLNRLTLSGSSTLDSVIGPGITRKNPHLQSLQTQAVVLSPWGTFQALKPTKVQAPLPANWITIPEGGT